MFAHPTRYVLVALMRYPIFVRNGEILAILIENGSFYNKVHIDYVEAL
jgi:uncharacterized membrane protein YobD (UPF0266 family)